MIYDVRHVTTYAYESAVSFARCSLRLEPKSGDGQQLISHSVDIRPRPAERTTRRDFFGTHTVSVLIEAAHRHLRIDFAFARVGRSPLRRTVPRQVPRGKASAMARSRPPASVRTRRSAMSLPVR